MYTIYYVNHTGMRCEWQLWADDEYDARAKFIRAWVGKYGNAYDVEIIGVEEGCPF